jgi:hypothetical protein
MDIIIDFAERWFAGTIPEAMLFFLTVAFSCIGLNRLWMVKIKPCLAEKNVYPSGYAVSTVGVSLVILLSVLITGLITPRVMIGDEVTHFYMLTTQAEKFPVPNFFAQIPTAWGEIEIRRYPHPFLWHYFGAVIYALTNGSLAAIQFYQVFFLAQLLYSSFMLVKGRSGDNYQTAFLYILVLASLPMVLIFSVAFYQDVPMTAQVVTAFVFLDRRRWLPATFFICMALWFKVNAFIFMPAFLLVLFIRFWKWLGFRQAATITLSSLLIMSASTWALDRIINDYAHSSLYPVERAEKIVKRIEKVMDKKIASSGTRYGPLELSPQEKGMDTKKEGNPDVAGKAKAEVIANHPGDLRLPVNYLIYGGFLLWVVCLGGMLHALFRHFFFKSCEEGDTNSSSWWLLFVGGWYTIITAILIPSAPDARFFLPGLPFLLLPLAEHTVHPRRPRIILSFFCVMAILQTGYVLVKTYNLRQVSPELQEAIEYVAAHPPSPPKVFMYPEGNYRLFPVPHEWYLGYKLRDFWRADNTTRIKMLQKYQIGAIVVKKYLIAPVDDKITNLGVYPDYFVSDIRKDPRFRKVFGNSSVAIYHFGNEP